MPSFEELGLQTVVRRPGDLAGLSMSRGATDRCKGRMGGLAGPSVSRGAMDRAGVGMWGVARSSATRPGAPHIAEVGVANVAGSADPYLIIAGTRTAYSSCNSII